MSEGPLTKQIAASIEDVKALLDDNRSLSVAFLSRRIRDIEEEIRQRLRKLETTRDARLASLEADVKKLKERVELASVRFRELRDKIRENGGEQT